MLDLLLSLISIYKTTKTAIGFTLQSDFDLKIRVQIVIKN